MTSDVLTVEVRTESEARGVVLTAPLEDYVSRLKRNGYTRIRMLGLRRLLAKRANGTIGDELTASIEPDAHFLLWYYARLEELVSSGSSGLHRMCVGDESMEFSAFVAPCQSFVRVGVFRDTPFAAPWAGGIVLHTETYLAMWRSIAAAIVRASDP
jgi:hypothetical protein